MDSTILVVEDDPRLREVITEALSDEGYAVYEACDGQGALDRISDIEPDLVLSDVMMPGLGGIELAMRLSRREEPIPIVLMSANGNAPVVGGTMFLAKPFSLDDLVALVDRLLHTKRSRGASSRRPVAFAL